MMNQALRSLVFISMLCANVHIASAQSADTLLARFIRYRKNIVHEKIFLHLDRTSYLTGETLWLKVYCVEAGTLSPIDLSRVAYIEIIDRSGKRALQTKIELKDGKGNGAIFLPATLPSDNYTVVAYTSWMKNFPKEYFFHQPVTIVNPFRASDHVIAPKPAADIDAQFFAEGGTILAGVDARVAFRVVDQSGKGIDFTGVLKDDSGNTLATFRPSRFGLGSFHATFEAGKRYVAEVTHGDGKVERVNLPEVQVTGYAMQVVEGDDQFDITVSASGFDEPLVFLFAHTNNQTIQCKSAFIKNGKAAFAIKKNSLKKGVTHLTLFNYSLEPVAERLVYTRPDRTGTAHIKTDNSDYSPRRPLKIAVTLSDKTARRYDASVSIFRKDSVPSFDHQAITSYLNFTSDLHGQIENPNYYFESGTAEDFDHVMLTHGWRKFSWEKISRSDFTFRWLPEVEGPILEGTLLDETGKPARNIGTYLSTPSKKIQLYTSVSDTAGNIRFTLSKLRGPRQIYLQTNFEKDSLYQFRLRSPFHESPGSYTLPPLMLSRNLAGTLTTRSIAMQVQDIFTESERSLFTEVDSLPFFGKPDETYYLDDFTRFPVMEEVMREYVKGVWVRKRKNEFVFIVLDHINKSVFNENPLILLDGVPVFRVNDIMNVNPLKIKRIDVLTRQLYLGKISLPGVVSFRTYSQDLAGITLDRKNFVLDYEGLQAARTFFAPVYDSERQRSTRVPDQRSTLLWMPTVTIADGQASVTAYTSDLPGTFEIQLHGISDDGETITGQHTFTVSNFNN